MQTTEIKNDICVLYVTATSFPAGIEEAHKTLHTLVPPAAERKYFGISRPEKNGAIVYRAAAEETAPGEGEKLHCKTLILRKGKYICQEIADYAKDLPGIGRAFNQLLTQPGLDPQGYCVEWYKGNHVTCMIRLEKE